MEIDWTHFTPYSALAGGLLIGLASAAFILLNGRVLGISGIIASLLFPQRGEMGWRIAFLVGMALAPASFALIAPPAWIPEVRVDTNIWLIILAGLCVGYGTNMASGCTSGHGVCGLSRLSPRSLVATLSFMGTGFIVVFLMRHGL